MKVFALVGTSGSGKSYNALKFAYLKKVEYIIDDGILIYKGKILAGISAKNMNTRIKAVKIAVFDDLKLRKQVLDVIKERKIKRLLVLGTSEKMIKKILSALNIKQDYEITYIEEIASYEEIEMAKNIRSTQGNHIVPIPTMELKKSFSGILKNPIRLFFKNEKSNEIEEVEKTIVRPTFSYLGKYFISDKVIYDLVKFFLKNEKNISNVKRIKVFYDKHNNLSIILELEANYVELLLLGKKIQFNLKNYIESKTMIFVEKIDILFYGIKDKE